VSATLHQLIELVPRLQRPVVLLEDGAGRSGCARLAWGARRRFRLDWTDADVGNVAWLDTIPVDAGPLYGTLSYELGLPPRAVRRAPPIAQPLVDLFDAEHEVVLDFATGRLTGDETGLAVVRQGRALEMPSVSALERAANPETQPLGLGAGSSSPVEAAPRGRARLLDRSFDQAGYEAAVRRVREHIAAGDVYQVNLAVAERFALEDTPWDVYRRLRAINPSPWMGFADFGDWQLVSGSPELLVEFRGAEGKGGVARARPIAGTRKKTGDPPRDAAMRRELSLDEKEQAEHRMLLDLARNDLGRFAAYGSVVVSEREVIEEYSHVYHLVSEVRAQVPAGVSRWDMIRAVFPGGTITGAPKIRAMEVIAELEPVARGQYTGGLGWFGPGGLQVNILIRSAVVRDGEAVVQAGAGIVWDSDPAREWRESLRKGAAMRAALGAPE
jgi:para-aminobenzoate synthetase component 1